MKRYAIILALLGSLYGCGGQQAKPEARNTAGNADGQPKAAKPITPKLSQAELDALLANARDP